MEGTCRDNVLQNHICYILSCLIILQHNLLKPKVIKANIGIFHLATFLVVTKLSRNTGLKPILKIIVIIHNNYNFHDSMEVHPDDAA